MYGYGNCRYINLSLLNCSILSSFGVIYVIVSIDGVICITIK